MAELVAETRKLFAVGLPLARKIARAHGGELRLEGGSGAGSGAGSGETTFTLTLPLGSQAQPPGGG